MAYDVEVTVCHKVLVRIDVDDPRQAVELAYTAGYQTKIPEWPEIAPFSDDQWEETRVEVGTVMEASGDESGPVVDVDRTEPDGVRERYSNPYPGDSNGE